MAENNYCVYMHVNKLNDKKYIGITCQTPSRRWQNGYGYKKQAFYNAIKKYGWDNFDHIILFEKLSEEEACEKEIELISKYKSDNKLYGYNITHGGENGHNDLWNDKDYRDAQIEERKSRFKDESYKNNWINSLHIAFNQDDYKEKQSKNTKGRWKSGEFDEVHCKKIICLETGESYKSITDASNITGICRSDIGKCCLGQMKTANGYHWQYYNDKLDSEENRIILINKIGKGKGKKIICVETGVIYDSIRDASDDINIDYSSIGKAVKGTQETAGGYHWKVA